MKKAQFTFARRPVDGLILLDKPQGMTSNQALQKVRNLFRAEKAGHTGALDPLATGVLPICLGEATKVAGLLLGNDKAYEVIAALGTTTDTDDADGPVLRQRSIGSYAREQVEALLPQFTGDIMQVPPVYSALKQGGEPMYLKARRGDEIDLPARPVRIHDIELLTLEPAQFSLRVTCGSGTYIRSLIRDLGEALGCGAHVTALHRLWVEPFQALPLRTLDGLQALAEQGLPELDAVLHPVAEALVAVPVWYWMTIRPGASAWARKSGFRSRLRPASVFSYAMPRVCRSVWPPSVPKGISRFSVCSAGRPSIDAI